MFIEDIKKDQAFTIDVDSTGTIQVAMMDYAPGRPFKCKLPDSGNEFSFNTKKSYQVTLVNLKKLSNAR